MKHFKTFTIIIVALVLLGTAIQPAAAQDSEPVLYTCLPTCKKNDARFLTVAGTGLQTLADESIDLQIAVDASVTSFE